MSNRVNHRVWTVAALVMLALSAAGCATSIADSPLIGLPSDAPARPKEVSAYPAVHDIPADREQSPMDPSEQVKVQKELLAARDRQVEVAAGKSPPANAKKPPTAKSATKSKTHPPPNEAKAAAITGVAERP
jgi:hypothetical protein